MASRTSKGLGQLIIVILIIIVVIGVLFGYFARAKMSAVDAKKKSEAKQIYTLIQFYFVGENISPTNPSQDSEWCEINKEYDGKKCLFEITRDGYAQAIPQSPDQYKYLYHDDDEKFLIAVEMTKDLSERNRCKYSDNPRMWCKVFPKAE